jgi:hypothetical protein
VVENGVITQICIVVDDVDKINTNWSKVLGIPEEKIETIFSDGILHFTDGKLSEYKDCRVAKYKLEGFILELIQPGKSPSPWRRFLEEHGQGVFHFCILVNERKVFQQTLSEIGVGMLYHIGYFPQGSYSYVDARKQIGLELSVNTATKDQKIFDDLTTSSAKPMDELR